MNVRQVTIGDEVWTYAQPDGHEEWVLVRIDPDRLERLQRQVLPPSAPATPSDKQ